MKTLARVAALSVLLALGATPGLAHPGMTPAERCGPGAKPVTGPLLKSLQLHYHNVWQICSLDVGLRIRPKPLHMFGAIIPAGITIVVYEKPDPRFAAKDPDPVLITLTKSGVASFPVVTAKPGDTYRQESDGRMHFHPHAGTVVHMEFDLPPKGAKNPRGFVWPQIPTAPDPENGANAIRGKDASCDLVNVEVRDRPWQAGRLRTAVNDQQLIFTYKPKQLGPTDPDACFFYIATIVDPANGEEVSIDPQIVSHGTPPTVVPPPAAPRRDEPIIPPPPAPINHGTPPASPQ